MKVVVLSGKQGSGKSTLQKELEKLGFAPLNFADALYDMHHAVLEILNKNGISRGPKDGYLLQALGDYGRTYISRNIWIDILKSRIEFINAAGGTTGICIGDCRFKNEFDAFPEALRVRLICPEVIRKKRAQGWRNNSTHQSEIDLDDYERWQKFDMEYYTGTGVTSPADKAAQIAGFDFENLATWRKNKNR